MLVMLLGQTRVLYSMANDGLLPKKFFADIHPQLPHALEEHDPGGLAGRHGRERDADRRHRQDGEHRHAAGLRDRVHRGHDAAQHQSQSAAAFPHPVGALSTNSRASSSTAT